MDSLKELQLFLQDDARNDLQILAVHEVLGLTGNKEGRDLLIQNKEVLLLLSRLVTHQDEPVRKDASLALINISSDEDGAKILLKLLESQQFNLVSVLLNEVVNESSSIADPACMILANLSRHSSLIQDIVASVECSDITLDRLVTIFTNLNYNTKGCKLHYLGPFFSNLSQAVTFRKYILDIDRCVIQRLLPFTEYLDSSTRRGGIIGVLRNCCFDEEYHEWLLSDKVDILPRLLLPLAGGEEFDDEDNEKLPVDLQYLDENKQREPDSDIRKMILEALEQLCATRKSREYIRSKNAYIILREYHKWEKNREVLLACENVIDILIRTEEEIGEDNLKALEVPEDYVDKFQKMDEEFVKSDT